MALFSRDREAELGARTHPRPVLSPKQLALFERFIQSGGQLSPF
jgi:hypothetical protein